MKIIVNPHLWIIYLALWPLGLMAAPADYRLYNIPLVNADKTALHQSMIELGGFSLAAHSETFRSYLKYFPLYRGQESYSIEIWFDEQQKFEKLRRIYRTYYEPLNKSLHTLNERQILPLIQEKIGDTPPQVQRKTLGGKSYNAYIWEDEQVRISLDRLGSDPFGNLVLEVSRKDRQRL